MEPLEEAVLHTLRLVAGHGIQRHCVDAAEDAVLDVGVIPLEAAEQNFRLLPLGAAAAVVAHGAVLGKAAGALDEFQLVVALPRQNIFLADAVHRADEGHAGEAGAVEHGRHGLQLGAVEHTHNGRLDDVVEVVAQCDFIAAQFLGLAVEVAAAHPGAEIAGVPVGVVGHREDVALEDGHRDVEQLGVGLDLLAIYLVVAGVHHQKDQLERHIAVALKLLHQLCHQHRVFATRDADGDLVTGLDELVALHRYDEGGPQLLAVFFDDAPLNELVRFHFAFHGSVLSFFSQLGQPGIAGVEGAEKAVQLLLRGQVAQTDAPRGEGILPVAADGEHRPGGQAVRRAGRLDRDADALRVQLPLEHGAFDVLNAQVQDVGDGTLRAVDADFWVLAQSGAEIQVCLFHPGRTLRQLIYRRVQSRLEGGRQSHRRRAAAVDGGAFAAVDERLKRQPPPLEQQADAVQAVELVGRQAHGVHALEGDGDLAHGLGGVYVQVAVGPCLQNFRNFFHRLHDAQLTVHQRYRYSNGVGAEKFFQVLEVDGAVPPDVHEVDFIALLLQSGQGAADGGVFQRGGDDVLAQMAGEFCQPLESKVIGLAGSRGIDDLGGLCAQQPRDALGGAVNDQFCVPACLMAGVCVAGAAALYLTKTLQHPGVCGGVGRIIQIYHKCPSIKWYNCCRFGCRRPSDQLRQ